MLRATRILHAGEWDAATAIDRVTLDHDARHRRRFRYVGEAGTAVLLDLPAAAVLGDGDGLLLDDGRVIAVAAAGEPLIEVRADTPALLMRLAWHIGNRHLPADIGTDRIRLRADHVIAVMLRGLGGTVAEIVAPFTPEAGAYAGGHAPGPARDHDHDAPGHPHGHDGHAHPHSHDPAPHDHDGAAGHGHAGRDPAGHRHEH